MNNNQERNIMGVERNIDIKSFPKQYSAEESPMGGIGRKVEVCFHYKADNTISGVIIRDDKESPFRTLIRLCDGRVVLATECQFRALPDIDRETIDLFTFNE